MAKRPRTESQDDIKPSAAALARATTRTKVFFSNVKSRKLRPDQLEILVNLSKRSDVFENGKVACGLDSFTVPLSGSAPPLQEIAVVDSGRILLVAPVGWGKTLLMADSINMLWDRWLQLNSWSRKPKGLRWPRVLVLAHSVILVNQIREELEMRLRDELEKDCKIDTEQGPNVSSDKCDVVVATWQCVHSSPDRLSRLDPERFMLVICDECHRAPSPCYAATLRYFNYAVDIQDLSPKLESSVKRRRDRCTHPEPTNANQTSVKRKILEVSDSESDTDPEIKDDDSTSGDLRASQDESASHIGCVDCDKLDNLYNKKYQVMLLGFSATPDKVCEGRTIGALFPIRLQGPTTQEMIEQGILSPVVYVGIASRSVKERESSSDAPSVRPSGPLATVLDRIQRYESQLGAHEFAIVRHCLVAQEIGRKKILIFCTNIQAIKRLERAFATCGVEHVGSVHSKMEPSDRSQMIEAFKDRHKQSRVTILINCMVLTEGFDCPQIDCAIIARLTNSKRSKNSKEKIKDGITQMIGRALRTHKDKQDCLILDFTVFDTDNEKKETGICTIPEVFGFMKEPEEEWPGYAGDKPSAGFMNRMFVRAGRADMCE